MTEKDPFQERMDSRRKPGGGARQTVAAAVGASATGAEARDKAPTPEETLEMLRARAHEGTRPDDIFGDGASQVCSEFLAHMRQKQFAGSVTLVEQRIESREPESSLRVKQTRTRGMMTAPPQRKAKVETFWEQRAYLLHPASQDVTAPQGRVYLCEDGMLRQEGPAVWVNVSDERRVTLYEPIAPGRTIGLEAQIDTATATTREEYIQLSGGMYGGDSWDWRPVGDTASAPIYELVDLETKLISIAEEATPR